jgi:hypothetical protein
MGRSTIPVVVQTDMEKSPNLTLIVSVERGIVTCEGDCAGRLPWL